MGNEDQSPDNHAGADSESTTRVSGSSAETAKKQPATDFGRGLAPKKNKKTGGPAREGEDEVVQIKSQIRDPRTSLKGEL